MTRIKNLLQVAKILTILSFASTFAGVGVAVWQWQPWWSVLGSATGIVLSRVSMGFSDKVDKLLDEYEQRHSE